MHSTDEPSPEGGFQTSSFKHQNSASASREVEILISNLLRFGVIISLCVVIFGTIITFVHHHEYVSQQSSLGPLTSKEAQFPATLGGVMRGLPEFQGRAIVLLGLLLLIATPVMRVAVSIFAFVYETDYRYVIITAVVLVLLILSFVLGGG